MNTRPPSPAATYFRHILTGLAMLGTYLFSFGFIDAASVDQVNQAGAELINPLCVILSAIAAVVMRAAISWLSTRFPALGRKTSGSTLLLVGFATVGFLGISLPSCSPAHIEAVRSTPFRIGIRTPDADIGYSSKRGLEIDAKTRVPSTTRH